MQHTIANDGIEAVEEAKDLLLRHGSFNDITAAEKLEEILVKAKSDKKDVAMPEPWADVCVSIISQLSSCSGINPSSAEGGKMDMQHGIDVYIKQSSAYGYMENIIPCIPSFALSVQWKHSPRENWETYRTITYTDRELRSPIQALLQLYTEDIEEGCKKHHLEKISDIKGYVLVNWHEFCRILRKDIKSNGIPADAIRRENKETKKPFFFTDLKVLLSKRYRHTVLACDTESIDPFNGTTIGGFTLADAAGDV